jgi:hypothetical protein
MKILPKVIRGCGECPYYVPTPHLNQGTCSFMIANGYFEPVCFPYSINSACPLEDLEEEK